MKILWWYIKGADNEYEKGLTALVQAQMSEAIYISVMPEKRTRYDLDLDAPFDQSQVENVETQVEGDNLEEILQRAIAGTATHLCIA